MPLRSVPGSPSSKAVSGWSVCRTLTGFTRQSQAGAAGHRTRLYNTSAEPPIAPSADSTDSFFWSRPERGAEFDRDALRTQSFANALTARIPSGLGRWGPAQS